MRTVLLGAIAVSVAAIVTACGTRPGSSGGGDNLPVSGSGPFRLLEQAPNLPFTAPTILSDVSASFNHPMLLAHGDHLSIWATFTPAAGASKIVFAEAAKLEKGLLAAPVDALTASATWENGSVSSPTVIEYKPWLMFYAAGGQIGLATSTDGRAWQKQTQPIFTAFTAGVSAVDLPSAVVVGDILRLYYVVDNAVWAAEAPIADVVKGSPDWKLLDGTPGTNDRDPMLASLPFAARIGHTFARAAKTPAGRIRYDLYATGFDVSDAGTPVITSGFASSFDGVDFIAGAAPIAVAGVSSPAAVPTGVRDIFFGVLSTGPTTTAIVVGQAP